jgi:hypothetical protein
MMRRSTLAWLAAAGALGCAPESLEIPPVTWAGEHLEYAPQDGAPEPCAGTLEYMDRYVARVAEAMGVELRGPVLFVHGSEDDPSPCSEEDYGCAFEGGVYSRGVPQEHELVHGVRRQYGGSMRFFEEGAAEAFGDDMPTRLSIPPDGDLIDGIALGSDRRLPIEWYQEAGRFVAFLHDEYGPAVTTALLLETDRSSTGGMAVTVIEQTTGLTFAEVLADYERYPACIQAQYRYPLVACDLPVDLRARCEENVELWPVHIACDDPSTFGPRAEGMFRYLVLEVEQDGMYDVTAFEPADPFAKLELKECTLGCDSILHQQLRWFDTFGSPVWLRAGRYTIKLPLHPDYPTDMVVKVKGLGCG